MPSAHKLELLVQPLSGLEIYGYVVIGIPEDQFLKLKAEFPDRQWAGQDPRINEAIKNGVTEDERKQIAVHFELRPWDEFKLEFRTPSPRYVDEAKKNPSFEMNGKKFWIFRNP
jgi:hypothetical protein